MRKIFILAWAMSFSALAQINSGEEAIILNQELQFLEDSVMNIQASTLNLKNSETSSAEVFKESELESTYFGEDAEEDVISTRSAGTKRRGF